MSADTRLGQRWTLAQRVKNALIYRVVAGALALVDRLPKPALLALTRRAGLLACALLRRRRRIAENNLQRAYPSSDARSAARRAFANAGVNLGRSLLLRRPDFRVADHLCSSRADLGVLEQALCEGRGAIFVSAHLGPFEWLAALVAELGLRPAVVVRESYDPRLDPLVDEHRLSRGIEVIHRGSPEAALRVLRALRAGRPVGFLSDLPGRIPTAPVRWFGREYALATGPQRFATRLEVPLLVGGLEVQSDGSFGVRIERLSLDAGDLTQRVADALLRVIDRSREHWLWMAQEIGGAEAAALSFEDAEARRCGG